MNQPALESPEDSAQTLHALASALLLSTAIVLVTAFAQEWIAGLVKSLQP